MIKNIVNKEFDAECETLALRSPVLGQRRKLQKTKKTVPHFLQETSGSEIFDIRLKS